MNKGLNFPLYVIGKLDKELLTIKSNGDVCLKGKKVGRSKELADIFTQTGETLKKLREKIL
ncbi:MAG TPA: hypothetical protein ENI13_00335 [candidate division CPR3 bacterium]|uniref:Uncharacterized protein n=1 Tax=candidate division CPR3 bacterium TaxID=2268181 RepID=A0A7C1NJJ8_UNCC3|nr:hypothetical protein [candidate division CPR3 bacterium]